MHGLRPTKCDKGTHILEAALLRYRHPKKIRIGEPLSARHPSKIAFFFDNRILSIFLLGVLSGLPWVMIGSALTLWLKEAGVSRTEIGYAGFIFGVFAVNFMWAPLVDRFRPSWFKHLGSRRTWVLGCQFVIIGMCGVMSQVSPYSSAKTVVLLALIIAIASATQDIAIDAFRVDSFKHHEKEEISAAAAAATAGWWSGYAGLGAVPLFLSDVGFTWRELYPLMGLMSAMAASGLWLGKPPPAVASGDYQERLANYANLVRQWKTPTKLASSFLFLAPPALAVWAVAGSPGLDLSISSHALYVPLLVLAAATLVIASLSYIAKAQTASAKMHAQPHMLDALPSVLLANVVAPLEDFFKRNGLKLGLLILAFVVVFKLGEAFLGRMSVLFYKEVGFSNTDIATYSKIITCVVTVAAAVPCGLLNARLGLIRGLFIAGIFMAASNLLFIILASVGPQLPWYFVVVVVDGFTTAWGSIAFTAFIALLCNHTFSATQYALLASLATVGRTSIASFSGQMVDALNGNWSLFFVITTLMVIPGLVMLWWLRKRLSKLVMFD